MRKIIVFALLSLLITGFIWGNSFKTRGESVAQSAPVAESLQPVVDPQEKIEKPVFHEAVRKMAHIAEFFLLGIAVFSFVLSLGAYLNRRFVSMPILIVLLVAVTDEFIQHFTGRGSLVTDVALDFAGSLLGMGLMQIARRLFLQRIDKTKKGMTGNE